MENQSDMISVVIPIYNAEKYLERCIKSVINQSYKNLEILLVDDGSTDDSFNVCKEWQRKDNRIKVFHSENKGSSAARNIGLRNIEGRYVGFVDADDEIEANMYEMLKSKMDMEGAEVGCCMDLVVDESGNVLSRTHAKQEVLYKNEIVKKFLDYAIPGGVCNKLFLKESIKSRELMFDEDITAVEDFLFLGKYFSHINKCVILDQAWYHYYQHENSKTHVGGKEGVNYRLNAIAAAERLGSYFDSSDIGLQDSWRVWYLVKVVDALMIIRGYEKKQDFLEVRRRLKVELRQGIRYILKSRALNFKYKVLIVYLAYLA